MKMRTAAKQMRHEDTLPLFRRYRGYGIIFCPLPLPPHTSLTLQKG